MAGKFLSISRRTRSTPFTSRVEASGVKSYTVYNHMLLPTEFVSFEEDYWHLCEHAQVWDVSVERQVELKGPDAQKLLQMMTPRDVSKAVDGQCVYTPLCNVDGSIINDPIVIRHSADHWWLSIADSDVKLWASGLATGFGLNVSVSEPDVFPLAVQGPKAEDLVAKLFDESIRDIRFFRGKQCRFGNHEFYVARSGWSKQGGFEIYVNDKSVAEALWDKLFELGEEFNVRPGCPNLIERIENGLLSYGNDIDDSNNPFECGLDQFINVDADIASLSHPALKTLKGQQKQQLMGFASKDKISIANPTVSVNGNPAGMATSYCWSPRYEKFIGFCMIAKEHAHVGNIIEVDGYPCSLHDLPFSTEALQG